MGRDVRKIDLRRLWLTDPSTIRVLSDIATAPKAGQDAVRDRTASGGVGALSSEQTTEPEPLPAPSAELVLIRVFVTSYLATAHERPKKRAEAFLSEAARLLESESSVALLLPMRPPSQHSELSKARRQAVTLFRQLVPTFVASLPGEEA